MKLQTSFPKVRRVLAWLKAQERAKTGLHLAFLLQEIWFETADYAEEGLDEAQRTVIWVAGQKMTLGEGVAYALERDK